MLDTAGSLNGEQGIRHSSMNGKVSEGSDTVDLKSKETHVIHKEGSRVRQEDTIPPKV